MGKWFTRLAIGAGFAVALFVMVAATNSVRVLGPADLAVMQEHLRREGYPGVRVVSGTMAQADHEVVVVMVVKLPDGTVRDMTYNLGKVEK